MTRQAEVEVGVYFKIVLCFVWSLNIRWWEEQLFMSLMATVLFTMFIYVVIEAFKEFKKEYFDEESNRDVGEEEAGYSEGTEGDRDGLGESSGRDQEAGSEAGRTDRPDGFCEYGSCTVAGEVNRFEDFDRLLEGIRK